MGDEKKAHKLEKKVFPHARIIEARDEAVSTTFAFIFLRSDLLREEISELGSRVVHPNGHVAKMKGETLGGEPLARL